MRAVVILYYIPDAIAHKSCLVFVIIAAVEYALSYKIVGFLTLFPHFFFHLFKFLFTIWMNKLILYAYEN